MAGSGWLGAGSLPASLITLLLISRQLHSNSGAVASLISYVLGYALLLTALSLLFRRRILALAHVLSLHRKPRREAAATVLLGGLLGVMVSLSLVGAAAIGVTMLVLLYPHLPIVRIIGKRHRTCCSAHFGSRTGAPFGRNGGRFSTCFAADRLPTWQLRSAA